MHKKSLFNAQFLLERFFLSYVSMVQKSNYCKLFCVTLLLIASYTNAETYYSRVATGNFADVSSWSISATGSPINASVLTAADVFIVQNGHSITVVSNQTIAGITINTGGTLTVGGFNFVVSGTTSISGTLIHNNATGTKEYTGLVSINSGGVWNNSGNSAISFSGGISTANTSPASFISGSGTQSFSTNPQILSGIGAIAMTTVSLSFPLTNNLSSFTVSNSITGSSLIQGFNSIFYFGNTSIASSLDATAVGNTVVYNRAGAQTVVPTTYSNLFLRGSGIKTTTSVTVNGILSVEDTGAATVSTALIYGANATLQYNVTSSRSAGPEWPATFGGSGGVIIKNTGTISLSSAKDVTNQLSIDGIAGAKLNLGTSTTHKAGFLVLNGEGRVNGTWGSTSSAAVNKNDINFSSTTGIITVANNGTTSLCNVPLRITPVFICQGAASKALNDVTNVSANQITGTFNTAVNASANRPVAETAGFDNTTICSFEPGQARSYVATTFQVSVSNNYTFVMNNSGTINGMGYLYTGNFTPGNCSGEGTFLKGDDDTRLITLVVTSNGPTILSVPLQVGVTYTLITTTYDANSNGVSFIWDVSVPLLSSGSLIAPKWYTAPTGGTLLGSGSSFNPVGVVNSGLPNTNTPGIYPFYVGFDSPACRTAVNYTIAANSVTLSSAVGTNAQIACINAPITNITYTATGAIGGSVSGLPAGVSGVFANNVFTISGTPTATGLFSYTVTLTGSCGNITASGTISVPQVPVAVAATAINCAGFTANWSGVVNATKYLLDISENNLFSSFVLGYNNRDVGLSTSYVVTALETGKNYYYRIIAVSAGCGNSEPSNVVAVTANATVINTWNGSVWSTGFNPTPTESIVFNGNYSLGDNFTGCSCTVNSGFNVEIGVGKTFTITNKLTVLGTGTLTFKDKSSLIQTTDVQNTGNIIYERSTTINRFDYTYYSSPVSGQTLVGLSPETLSDKFLSFDGANTAWFYENSASVMTLGKGYTVRGPQSFHETNRSSFLAKFTGIPNNGPVTGETVIAGKSYIAGNPYPSAIKVSDFLAANSFLEGTVRFWTHNGTLSQLGSLYVYSAADYAPCNATGCSAAQSGGVIPNGFIASGQSVMVKAKTGISASPIVFNNSMRKADTNDNSVFFKPVKKADPEVKIWLNFTHPEGIFKQLLIGYVPGATNGYEDSYDGTTLDANPYADFYSICDGKNLVIQGRSLPWTADDVVVLGYRSAIVGTFAISIDHTEGNVENVNVFLHDKLLNVFHNLKLTPYVFATLQGTFKERFALKYIDNSLGTGDFEAGSNEVVVSVKNKTIQIASTSENLKNVFVYDISGKLLYEKNKIDTTSLAIESLPFGNQVLVVKVILDNNYETSRKVVF